MSVADTGIVRGGAVRSTAKAGTRTRDIRLDFFRGIAMFIILIAHTPGNPWVLWIPARFGFSDATEIFVFCSGMASAIAFGRSFADRGWWLGTARVVFRCWQVYWAHIGLFLAIAMLLAALNATQAFEANYIASLNLVPFFNNPETQLVRLMTLTYVPNYFDILPMYLVILAMMPLVVAAQRLGVSVAAALVAAIWVAANLNWIALPAESWSEREWFFNPFGWQLVFFTGFAFMAGWIPAPPVNRSLIAAALAVVLLTIPVAWFRLYREVALFADLREFVMPLAQKTDFGPLRFLHFLALAYLAWTFAGDGGDRLRAGAGQLGRIWQPILSAILKVGQQSLAVFVFSMFFARLIGVYFDVFGRSFATVLFANAVGLLSLVALAYTVAWFKSQPWRRRAQ